MSKYFDYINEERLKDLFIKMAEVDTGSCEEYCAKYKKTS